MIANIPYIEQKFEEYNQQMFDGKLPKPKFELSNVKTYLGLCVFKRRRSLFGKVSTFDFRLRFNVRYDLPQQELDDTIIHEMIHYYIHYHRMNDTSAHGKVFRQIMQHINQKFNRHLTISHRLQGDSDKQPENVRVRWHVVAVITLKNGKTGFKVLPRVVPTILKYYNAMTRCKEVSAVSLF